MDGYARFDRGSHKVFLAIDENYSNGAYIDILATHELTHVARESRPSVWEGFGLNPKMSQSEFTQFQPVIEHLVGEGLSCAVSEKLVPGQGPWLYAYQDSLGYEKVLKSAKRVDPIIKREILHPKGDYGRLYETHRYGRNMPGLTHYVWAWHWTRQLLQDLARGDFRWLLEQCSKDFIQHALSFEL
jgi:hypothetical protein